MLTTLGPSSQPLRDHPLWESLLSSPSDKQLSALLSLTAVAPRFALVVLVGSSAFGILHAGLARIQRHAGADTSGMSDRLLPINGAAP
jgi:hypothetical protein